MKNQTPIFSTLAWPSGRDAAPANVHNTTGLILAGGRGRRMGGSDKGWQLYRGLALVQQALQRLQPQVSQVLISANRNLARYGALGVPVWPDLELTPEPEAQQTGIARPPAEQTRHPRTVHAEAQAQVAPVQFNGPLAGVLTGLTHCTTPYLMTVPCDAVQWPLDLLPRLSLALHDAQADLATVATVSPSSSGGPAAKQLQPVFCLMKAELLKPLRQYLQSGQRQIRGWIALQRHTVLELSDADAFAGANTWLELAQLEQKASPPSPPT
jgi:molybdenum cofactor guanylyltransferase